jgi:hypothetical protein
MCVLLLRCRVRWCLDLELFEIFLDLLYLLYLTLDNNWLRHGFKIFFHGSAVRCIFFNNRFGYCD